VAQLDKGVGVKLTIAQYMTPKNRKIQAVGISPDLAIEEVDQAAFEKDLKEDRFLREKDLRNHLTATIETPAEKAAREAQEKEERLKKIRELEEKKKTKKIFEDEVFRTFKASEDYQVLQAVRYLQGYNVFKETKNQK
jgi:carboxyl-terminal processing protease